MKASLKNYRQTPRKVRLVANLIKGKSVSDAKAELEFNSKKSSKDIKKLLLSAEANAVENDGADASALKIKDVRVDAGITMKRYRPGWRGRAFPYKKRTSNIKIELESKAPAKKESKKEEPKVETPKTKSNKESNK